jgi:hypothetical protein
LIYEWINLQISQENRLNVAIKTRFFSVSTVRLGCMGVLKAVSGLLLLNCPFNCGGLKCAIAATDYAKRERDQG